MSLEPGQLELGQKVKITGLRGDFILKRLSESGAEATCWGGTPQRERWRTITVDRLKPVLEKRQKK